MDMMIVHRAITFDDVSLVPQYTEAERGDINIHSELFGLIMKLPIISSPMDTISGINMLKAMRRSYALGIHHRYCDSNSILQKFESAHLYGGAAVAPSMGTDFIAKLIPTANPWATSPIFCLDVAHGHTKRNLDFARFLVEMKTHVISGNIVTPEAAEAYLKVGVKVLRVGIGSGSVCTTRVVTGVGVPQLSAIQTIRDAVGDDAIIVSDGGHRTTGDIVKSLAFGADFVMLGGMLAGTDEAEGMINYINTSGKQLGGGFATYRGMASYDALSSRKSEFFVEGVSKEVTPKGSVIKVLDNIKDAIETACYYLGASNLKELRGADYVYVTQNGWKEGLPQ